MSNGKLTFKSTVTVADFKAKANAASLQILQNKGRSPFFTCGGITGPVSHKGYSPDPMVSLVADETGKEFYLLHPRGASAADVLATL